MLCKMDIECPIIVELGFPPQPYRHCHWTKRFVTSDVTLLIDRAPVEEKCGTCSRQHLLKCLFRPSNAKFITDTMTVLRQPNDVD